MSKPRVAHTTRSDASHEARISALAAVYRLVILKANRHKSLPERRGDGRDTQDKAQEARKREKEAEVI